MNKKYKSLVVVGSQWGDEGKGKITDYFAQDADMVVRYAGGDNAGHMIEFNGKRHKVTLVPSGIFSPHVKNVIGNGTVINLHNLVVELKKLQSEGIDTKNLFLSDRAHLIFDYHLKTDAEQEEARKENRLGTTKKGIGPAYADKIARFGFRLADFRQPNFKETFEQMWLDRTGGTKTEFEAYYKDLMADFQVVASQIIDSGEMIEEALMDDKFVLFEGAQGVLLDIDHGTYPFVTSSNTTANNASTGSGIHRKQVEKVVGVVKAYNTRVGTGGMPTEIFDETADRIRERGHEYGSNTKRPRRIGWLDLVALKYALRTGGIDEMFLTLFDVLDKEKTIKLAVGYELDGKTIKSLPANDAELRRVKPVYIEMPGWETDITNVKSFAELPQNAQNYMKKIEEITGTKFLGFSVGPDRKQTIMLKGAFDD
ncbi:adenylosuccinate synthetase [Entomoplasma freundtii]|uniref:Adenylosuccinate synthetase n=1 Tax=Entomoplasma freundtii TaxID=74700 RepID=A0A2K8NTY3_9MOLU|nr:adenylosuccinate synthase [Entomoplasma freundtii]ATZ16083.1 adenylosuccinate synthetase [Entomoplasma freundtii]TDY57015.1 adenylosuccinate synthetase [Entomoplasma freundtii]